MHAKTDLEMLARKLPEGQAREMVEALIEDPYPAARALLMIGIHMGSNAEWDSAADYLEWIADEVGWAAGMRHPGNDGNTPLYRLLAAAAGMEYDGQEEEDAEDEAEG